MPAVIRYSAPLVVASVGVACVFGLLSLWLGRIHRRDDPRLPRWRIVAAGAVMGVAIAGQHYTGMAAADFHPGPDTRVGNLWRELPTHALPEAVLIATFAILALALGAAALDRRRGAHALVSQRLLLAQERERRRIARVLHDDLGQLLTAIRLNLQRQVSASDPTIRDDSVALVDEALARVRALSLELRPSVLDDLGLGAAIQWYAHRSAGRGGYDVTVNNAVGEERFPEAIETAAYRVVQEALTNVARHAGARHVRIGLEHIDRALEVHVRDDGCGFDVDAAVAGAQAGESLGLLDMRETAMMAGGRLGITSVLGRGTNVSVRFPLPS